MTRVVGTPVTLRRRRTTLTLVRGLGLADTLADDSRRRDRIVAQWATMLDAAIRP
jgi:hypothetical protein